MASYGAHGQGAGDGAHTARATTVGGGVSSAGAGSVGSARQPSEPDPFKAPPARPGPVWFPFACFHQSEASWGHSLAPLSTWVPPGAGAVEAGARTGNLCLSFHRRPVSGCLREGGEVTALGLPSFRVDERPKSGVAAGSRGGAERGVGSAEGGQPEPWVPGGEASRDFSWGPTGIQAPALLRKCTHPHPPFSFSYSSLTRPTNTTSYTAWP